MCIRDSYPGASYQEETDMFTPEILLVDGDDELLDDAAAVSYTHLMKSLILLFTALLGMVRCMVCFSVF